MIYFVDDNVEFLKSVRDLLGDSVKTFDFPTKALNAALIDRPNVIVTDVFMPLQDRDGYPAQGMDGLTLIDVISAVMPHVKLVVVSGNTKDTIEQHYPGKLSKVSHFFEKPLNQSFLDKVLELEKSPGVSEFTVRLTEKEIENIRRHKKYLEDESLESNIIRILGESAA